VIDELERGIKESIGAPPEGGQQKFYGVVVGKVINPLDPLMLGRVQVQTPFVDSLDLSPWARIAQGMAGPLHGDYFVPNLGDEVLLAFEHGDVNVPYILGSLANMVSRPPLPSPLPQVRAIRTLVGNQIVFTEAPPTIIIQNGPTPPVPIPAPPVPAPPYQTIVLSNAGVQILSGTQVTIQVGANLLSVTQAGIVMQVGPSTLALTAVGIVLDGPIVNLQASGQVGIFGPTVRINS
jgi:Type VI secretion system/phage-baseplate injector OB domain